MVVLRLFRYEKELCLPQSSVNDLMILYSEPITIFIYKMDLKINWHTDCLHQAATLSVQFHLHIKVTYSVFAYSCENHGANVCCRISNNFQNGVISECFVYSSLGNFLKYQVTLIHCNSRTGKCAQCVLDQESSPPHPHCFCRHQHSCCVISDLPTPASSSSCSPTLLGEHLGSLALASLTV